MNYQDSMICPRCGSTMTFRKFFDYGGHFWGWGCIFCKEIIEYSQQVHPSPKQDRGEKWRIGRAF